MKPIRRPLWFIPNQSAPKIVPPEPGFPDENASGCAFGWRGPGAGDWLIAQIRSAIAAGFPDVVWQLPHGKSIGIMSAAERYIIPAYKQAIIMGQVVPAIVSMLGSGELNSFMLYTGAHFNSLYNNVAGNQDPRWFDRKLYGPEVFLENYALWLGAITGLVVDRGNSVPPNFQDNRSRLIDFAENVADPLELRILGESCTVGEHNKQLGFFALSESMIPKGTFDYAWDPAVTDNHWMNKEDDAREVWSNDWTVQRREDRIRKFVDAGWVPVTHGGKSADLIRRVCTGHKNINPDW